MPIGLGASYYAKANVLSPDHYQALMDRGWRRSGSLLYVPDVSRSCCPHYTLRLPAKAFKPTRDQRHALNRWNRFVLGEECIKQVNRKFPKTKEEKKHQNNTFDLTATVHEAELPNLKPGIDPQHRFEVNLEPDKFTEEKFALFDNYQRNVHHEGDSDISRSGFKRFLCASPVTRRIESTGKQIGSYHQCYRLDGRLIAMAVLDLLPHAVSGVYLIYHSDFEKWSFGKLSALREAALALEQGYQYYYMGYYIHSCKKMRYKGDYKPQYVLDYNNLEWDPLDDEMRNLMDRRKYARCHSESAHSEPGASDLDQEEAVPFPTPLKAIESGLSLLQLGVPGILSLSQLHEQVDLDRMKVQIARPSAHEMRDIQQWHAGDELDHSTLKGVFAEFAAAVGPVVAREAVVDFSR
ncbi:related to arginine-tRNA- transferase [Lecanosticta acicola]|uniref:Arginyl-tRNA--protein transferase 1 n=1 Tax=Lecanosticta acicola TaxID=111012 RepID=A0AAI8Z3B7_9PEZI|nr:related to arginine-tRNA- transferase [Lecanosticta acicola]